MWFKTRAEGGERGASVTCDGRNERLRQETLCHQPWTDEYVEHPDTLMRQNVVMVWLHAIPVTQPTVSEHWRVSVWNTDDCNTISVSQLTAKAFNWLCLHTATKHVECFSTEVSMADEYRLDKLAEKNSRSSDWLKLLSRVMTTVYESCINHTNKLKQ